MEVTGSIQPNWQELISETQGVETFLGSVNTEDVGDGRMSFRPEDFKLESRSTFLKGFWLWQYITTIGDLNANFESTRDAFSILVGKSQNIHQQVTQFNPQSAEECLPAKQFLDKLMDVYNRIQRVSDLGLKKLCENYHNLKKDEEAVALENLGTDAFRYLKKSEEHLYRVLLPFHPELENDTKLKRYYSNSEPLLVQRDRSRINLRRVTWDKDQGLIIPQDLATDCKKDMELRKIGPNRAALQVAATHIGIPQMASRIPTLQGQTAWNPHRVVKKKEGPFIEKGVVGSCERGVHLTNAYSRLDDNTAHVMMGCGLIDTELKAREFIEIMKGLPKERAEGNWIFHQLNSFTKEKQAILSTHAQVPYIEKELIDAGFQTSFLHVNTCYNVCFSATAEKAAFKEINREGLFKMAGLVCNETQLLQQACPNLKTFANRVDIILNWIKKIKITEEKIRNWSQNAAAAAPKVKLSDLKAEVIQYNQKIDGDMKPILEELAFCITQLTEIKPPNLAVKRALLFYQLLDDIFMNQLDSAKPMSPTSEIERYLLLYRMLNLKPVFICKKGLDRSGAVRALAEAQYHLEELFYKAALETQKEEKVPDAARFEAQQDLYFLLKEMDTRKAELFRLTLEIAAELQFPLVKDLNDEKTESAAKVAQDNLVRGQTPIQNEHQKIIPTNLRNSLQKKLEEKIDVEKATDLYHFQVYLEMVLGASLLEQEKTLNDSGALGFKYHHDDPRWLYRKAKNPHPPERWPLFLLTDQNVPIQILEIHTGWLNGFYKDPITITPAGLALTHRLSQLR